MLKLIRFRGIWIKILIPVITNFLYGSFATLSSHVIYHVDNESKSSRSLMYRVPILIQNRITVTRCTHNTLLYHLYIMLEKERTKRKSKIIFFLSIQKRGDLSTSCIRDFLSVISCPLYQITWRQIVSPGNRTFFIQSVTWISLNTKWPLRLCRISTFSRCNFE